uniref:Centrosomal protein of 290kDa coiled-coil region domain-containing protein n=1 Tax=Poecilia formosa TaxID=48698 RepID=A0A096LQC9_POEFO
DTKISMLKQEVRQYEQTISETEEEVKKLQNKLQETESKNKELQNDKESEMERERIILKLNYQRIIFELKHDLQLAKIDLTDSSVGVLHQAIEDRDKTIDVLCEKVEHYTKRIEKNVQAFEQQETKGKKGKLKDAEQRANNAEQALYQAKVMIKEKNKEVWKVSDILRNYTAGTYGLNSAFKDLESFNEKILSLKQENNIAQEERKQAEDGRMRAEEKAEELKFKNAELEKAVAKLKDKKAAQDANAERQEACLQEMKKREMDNNKIMDVQKDEISLLRSLVKKKEQTIHSLEENQLVLQEACQLAEGKFKEHLSSTLATHKHLEEKLKEKEDALKKAEHKILSSDRVINDLRLELSSLSRQQLQADQAVAQELASLRQEYEDISSKLSRESASQKRELHFMQQLAEREAEEFKVQVKYLKDKLQGAEKTIIEFRRNEDSMRNKMKDLIQEIEFFQKRQKVIEDEKGMYRRESRR